MLDWNWDSRDVVHGRPTKRRQLPSLTELKLVLNACKVRETAMVWLAVGCGFGQRDVAAIRVGQIDKKGYDLRRGKTGVERYGDTPPMVWKAVEDYLHAVARDEGELMFITVKGMPVVHRDADSIKQWWRKLRSRLGEEGQYLGSGRY